MKTFLMLCAFVLSNPFLRAIDPPTTPSPAPGSVASPAPIVAGAGQLAHPTADQIADTIQKIRDDEARMVAAFQAEHAKIIAAEAAAVAAFQAEQSRIAGIAAKLKIAPAGAHLRLAASIYGQEGTTIPAAQPQLFIDWSGSDPTGFCRVRNPQTNKIVARHVGQDGKVVDVPAGFTEVYTGPDGPTEATADYPLFMRIAK